MIEFTEERPTLVRGGAALRPDRPVAGAGRPRASGKTTFRRRTRDAVLTAHIAVSVALVGDAAALVAVALRAMGEDDPEATRTMYEVLSLLSMAFGIPLSLAALATGVALGVGTKWGVFRYGWVIAKLALIVAVMAVGALVTGPAQERLITDAATGSARTQAEWTMVIGAAAQGAALLTATGLSVFKPRRRRASRRARTSSRAAQA